MKLTLKKTFVTLTTCKNIFSDVYFTVQWLYHSTLRINSHDYDLVQLSFTRLHYQIREPG
jgi:hypothetical protein